MSHVFISYSHEDRAVARRYVDALQAAGLTVWWDEHLRSGESFDDKLESAIRAAAAVIVLWSKASVASRWVRAEATLADRSGTLVPVMISPCERPIIFELTHTVELAHWQGAGNDRAWQALLADVRRLIAAPRAAPASLSNLDAIVATPLPPRETLLAVLPFDNLSSDTEMLFFSDGVSDDILGRIMRGSKLKVIGRTSSFQFRGADKPKAAAALNATHILDGSIRRAGSKVRIAAHLTETASHTTLWSERYDRDLDDIFAMQDEISEAIAQALDIAFFPANATPIDPALYDLYLRNKDFVFAADGLRNRVAALEKVTKAAPDYADGWGALGLLLGGLRRFLPYAERPAVARQAMAVTATCRRLDSDNPAALVAEAYLFDSFGNFLERHDWIQRALPLATSVASVAATIVIGYISVGRNREAIEMARCAFELDPLSGTNYSMRGQTLFGAGRNTEARDLLESYLEQSPDNYMVAGDLILINMIEANWPKLDALIDPARLAIYPLRDVSSVLPLVECLRSPTPEAKAALFEETVAPIKASGYADAIFVRTLASIGFVEDAYELLETIRLGPSGLPDDPVGMKAYAPTGLFSANFPAHRADPRFVKLCARLGLVEYWLGTQHWPDCADEVPYDFKAECERYRDYPKDVFLS